MTSNVDPFTVRIAVAIARRKQNLADQGGIGLREPPTAGLAALADIFDAFAGPTEREPASIVVGLDCSTSQSQTLARDVAGTARDALALYDDHALVVCNPARGANLGRLVKLALGGLGTSTRNQPIPHYRLDRASTRSADLLRERPLWGSEHGAFVHIHGGAREIWFWAELMVDSEEAVQASLARLASRTAS